MRKKFALIGAAGYIAPRHMKAIKETDNVLVAALDKNDSVGVMDTYFPGASFFTEYERFDRHLEKLKRQNNGIDYLSICSPNYLHDAHCRAGLRLGADVICEKPLVLNPWNIDALQEIEEETGHRIYNILQLRLHPSIIKLKQEIEAGPKDKVYDVDLKYITSRGKWYHVSWKGDLAKSGGIATNIGVHFFDMLIWIFGDIKSINVERHDFDITYGQLELDRANVNWKLSVNHDQLPGFVKEKKMRTYRSISVDGNEIEFSTGFENLHNKSYQHILNGDGFGTEEVRRAIDVVSSIRNSN